MATEHARVAQWQNDLLPHIVDRLARETPDAPYGLWPVAPASYEAGFRTITYGQLANVVNGLAWLLIEQLGPGRDSEVLTYVGPNDVRLTALVLAAVKAGYVLFLTSPRNSPAAQRHLFETLKCRTLVTTDPPLPAALAVLDAVQPRQVTVPSVEELLGTTYRPYVYSKTFEEVRWDPLFIVHTSGSTSMPKPMVFTHETSQRHSELSSREPPNGTPSLDHSFHGKRVMVTLPQFHGAGIAQYLMFGIPFGNIPVALAAAAIPTAEGLVDALKKTPADIAILVPSVVAELAQNPSLLEYCAEHLELILYIGGDLPQAIGDRVAAKILLRCQWGASEVGIPHQLLPSELGPTDWHYIRLHPGVGAVFDELADGTYELVIRRDEALADTQTTFTIQSQRGLEKEYRTRDLFAPHPTVPDAWCWRARADDIIVFLNGEKTNPVSMEQHIVARNPELGGAIVVGAQRFQAGLLIEPVAPASTTAEQAALVERVWPSVDEANRLAPAHARVVKSLILVAVPDRPFARAGKGTIQRAASVALYGPEIEKLYADADAALDDDADDGPLDLTDVDEISRRVRTSISAVTGWSDLYDTASFFDRGMDSLQALELIRALRRSLHRPDLGLSTVYQHPSVSQLTAVFVSQKTAPDDRDIMASLLSTYRGLIHQLPRPKYLAPNNEDSVDVILTGSTGTVGTFILHTLLHRPGIGHIYCLNRSQDGGRATQNDRFATNQLATDAFTDRVTFLHADLAHPSLGLDATTYETLRGRVGLVIHNAWPVNFNLSLSAFRPHLAGLVNLFALSSSAAPRTMRVLFISSVSAASGRSADAGPALETVYESFDTPYPNGYARSKFLSELLCDAAARHLGIPVSVARVGQVAGSVRQQGVWNRAEWLPSLVISSLHLGCLPEHLGSKFSEIDWVPSDLLADAVLDLATQPSPAETNDAGAQVFNVRNANTTTWASLLPAIQDAERARLGRQSEVVPPSAWVARLQESIATAAKDDSDLAFEVASNPAIKLLEFYRDGLWGSEAASLPMAVDRAQAASLTLRDLPPVGLDWMRKWVDEWISGNP